MTKFIVQDEYNHNKNNDSEYGFTILGKYKDFKLGYGYESFDDQNEIKINYKNLTLDYGYINNYDKDIDIRLGYSVIF